MTARTESSVDPIAIGGIVSLDAAQLMVDAAVAIAARMRIAIAVVVVDAAGEIVVQARMTGAWPDTGDSALAKASTACSFDLDTGTLAHDGHPIRGLFTDRLGPGQLIFAGGLPVHAGPRVIGGVGVSGGLAGEDQACAEAALRSFSFRRR